MSSTVINIFVPCLLFSKTVPSFTADNLGEVGVLILTAAFYQSEIHLRLWLINSMWVNLCLDCSVGYTPARLEKWTSICGNFFKLGYASSMKTLTLATGDIPLAFVMTLTATAPFTTQDQALGVAYISIVIVWCFLTMFPFGGWMLVKRDFETATVRADIEAHGQRSSVRWLSRVKGIAITRGAAARVTCTNNRTEECIPEDKDSRLGPRDLKATANSFQVENRRLSTSMSIRDLDIIRPIRSHTSEAQRETELQNLSLVATPSHSPHSSLTSIPTDPLYKSAGRSILKFLLSLISPPTIACLLSLLIALVPQLKALFVADVPGVNMPHAPDGMPPLEWILDIANFGGNRS